LTASDDRASRVQFLKRTLIIWTGWGNVSPMKKTITVLFAVFAMIGCAQKSAEKPAKKPATTAKAKQATPAKKAKAAPPVAAKPSAPAAGSQPARPPKPAGLPAPADVAAAPADAVKTASGLASKVLKAGKGTKKPVATDTVKVHYTGWTTDGKMFDSSVQRGQPATFPLNGVIKGWTEGVALMVEGEKRRFWIPGNLAYGDKPSRPGAPSGTLVFDVELIEIEKAQSPEEAKAAFDAFSKALVAAADAVCACKEATCARAAMGGMSRVKPPKGRPSPEQIKLLQPHMNRIQSCGMKLEAAAKKAAPVPAPKGAAPTGARPTPAPAGK
jgi:FKBP-type peptidyl-prolyl cis-trans isomerase